MNTNTTDPLVLAHDLGTTGDKATLVAPDGSIVGSVTVPYPADFGSDGRAEQQPDDWWNAFCEANHRLLESRSIDPSRIAGVSFSGQMMGAVLLDDDDRPVRPAIIWEALRRPFRRYQFGEDMCTEYSSASLRTVAPRGLSPL